MLLGRPSVLCAAHISHTVAMPATHSDLLDSPHRQHYSLTTDLIAREVIRRGHPHLIRLSRYAFAVKIDGHLYAWRETHSVITSAVATTITERKDRTRRLLRDADVAIAKGGARRPGDYDSALALAHRLGWPVFIKPTMGTKGRGVVQADNPEEFAAAWQDVTNRVVIEKRFPGQEARFLVVDGRCVAVAGRTPANVVGDGVSTIGELIDAKNVLRSKNLHLMVHPIRPRDNIDLEMVPNLGDRVTVDHRGGFSSGADSLDLTDTVHRSYREVAERATRAIPGLGVAGVDIMAADWSKPAKRNNHIVIEVNSRPGIGAHHFPWEGEPRDVARAIVDACLPGRWRRGRKPA